MAQQDPDITVEELRKMTPEERIRTLRAMQAAKRKRLEEEERRLRDEIRRAGEIIEETEEEVLEELERDEPPRREEPEEEESLEEMLGGVEPEDVETGYKTGTEYDTEPGTQYEPSARDRENTEIDERLGFPNRRDYNRRDEQSAYRHGEEGVEGAYRSPEQQREHQADEVLGKMYRR